MERLVSYVAIRRYDYVLKSLDVAEKGKMAFGDAAGSVVTMTPGGVPLGVFATSLVGDGVKKVTVQFWNEIFAYWWANDTAALLTLANLWDVAYVKDSATVSGTGTVALGLILDIDAAQGVLVYSTYPAAALVPPVI